MRTLVISPVRSKRRQISTDNELYYEVSPQPSNNNDIKPNTALFSPRQSVISKGKSVVQLYQARSRILSATQNQRVFSRSKSRNKEGIPLYGSTFSKNWFQGSRSSIDFKTARKYEIEIMELQKEIYAIKEETRDANNKLSQLREEKLQSRNILSNILQSVVTEIKSEIITKKRKCKLFQGSKTHRNLASSLDDKVIGEFRLSETNSPKNTGICIPLNQSKENDSIAIELLESKERVIRLLMTQSGLFKNN